MGPYRHSVEQIIRDQVKDRQMAKLKNAKIPILLKSTVRGEDIAILLEPIRKRAFRVTLKISGILTAILFYRYSHFGIGDERRHRPLVLRI